VSRDHRTDEPAAPTDADRRWLLAAIELSRQAPPTATNYAVGALVVDADGTVLATGFTGEIGPRDHAEEAALAKLAGRPGPNAGQPGPAFGWLGPDLSRATVYSSLEPCTARKSRPGTCTDLILAAGLRRVVLALREPLLFVDCHGVETLRAAGAEVIEIGDLGPLVREINAHVLDLRPADGRP
jgi:diaminohydroxyphosphoribosylaminopyrimidine deaminase/5-amino-6-(5-phosphoribosylamino)uracil reductase